MSAELDVIRKTEEILVGLLTPAVALLTPLRILPGGGNDRTPPPAPEDAPFVNEDVGALVPPYAVFGVVSADEFTTGSNTYTVMAKLLLLTLADETSPQQHAAWLNGLKLALDNIVRPADFPDQNFRLNGYDITGPWERVDDNAGQFRCHALPLAMGVYG